MPAIIIRIDCTDQSDLDWLRNKCVPAVENEVDENEDRLDGKAEVSWDIED